MRRGHVLEVTLDRPKVNAIDIPTSQALAKAFVELRDDPELRVGFITGGGEKVFSAGWDLKALNSGDTKLDNWWEARLRRGRFCGAHRELEAQQAGDRGAERAGDRRRLRDRHGLRPHHRRRPCRVRTAGDATRHRSRCGRFAAAAAAPTLRDRHRNAAARAPHDRERPPATGSSTRSCRRPIS